MMCTRQQQQLVHAANPDLGTGHIYVTTKIPIPGHLRLSSQFPIATNCRSICLTTTLQGGPRMCRLGSTRLSPLLHTHFPEGHMERRAATSHHTTYHRHGGGQH